MAISCDTCARPIERQTARCPNCGSSSWHATDRDRERWRLEDSIHNGLNEAVNRGDACIHACPHVSLTVAFGSRLKYARMLRRCAYTWFLGEYPPDNGIIHDAFMYPV